MSQEYVSVTKGYHADAPGGIVEDVVFPLVRDYKVGKKGGYITVDGTGNSAYPQRNIRIKVDSPLHYERVGESVAEEAAAQMVGASVEAGETDTEIMARIAERFEILGSMTQATIDGDVRAMIVTGPPGVCKSYIVETTLEKAVLFDKIAGKKIRYDVVKGAMTALGLYAKLYEYSDKNNVLVFDDCDTVLFDDLFRTPCLLQSIRRSSSGREWQRSGVPSSVPPENQHKSQRFHCFQHLLSTISMA